MERESFEDQEVADLLNANFISIKVDREERPDIDHLYMSVTQGITGHGGWPMTIIMTPEQRPFFAGTYFPKQSRMGMSGLMEILKRLSALWRDEREKVLKAGEQIMESVNQQLLLSRPGELSRATLDQAYASLAQIFDPQYGGFGKAPKFPTPHNLCFLLRFHKQSGEKQALQIVEKTLDSMAKGGIYDHVGYGFARYSTDREWLVPHFEKMLYDNAQLAIVLLETYQVTKNQQYSTLAERIFSYIMRDMTSPEGGFYSAEDADSEGVEGKFYVWTQEEIFQLLGQDLGQLYCRCYGITPQGNFEGKNIPNLIHTDLNSIAREQGLPPWELSTKLDEGRQILFSQRERRIHPHKDDKILTAWNGLMIAALAKGAQVLDKQEYAQASEKAAQFILDKLVRQDGRLLARYRDGEAAYPGYVDDYAFMIWGLLELYEATFKVEYLSHALQLNEEMLKHFWDEENGGLFMYGSDSEQLLSRPKEVYDGATPSGNSVAALNLLRLSRLTGKTELEEYSSRIFRAFAGNINDYPAGYTSMLSSLWFALTPGKEIVVAGRPEDLKTDQLLDVLREVFLPEGVVMRYSEELAGLVPSISEQKPLNGESAAYVCENFTCRPPVTDPAALSALVNQQVNT